MTVTGPFRSYEPDGIMRTHHPSGFTFVGRLKNAQPDGEGEMQLPGGKVVVGDFSEPVQKKASIRYPNGNRYVGPVAFYMAQGQGVLTFADGSVYQGNFERDQPQGAGKLTPAPGSGKAVQQGQWARGKFVGKAAPQDLAERPSTPAQTARNNEAALYNQNTLLARQAAALKPHDPGKVEMYALYVAGDGSQEVFRREVEYVSQSFEQRFDTAGRSMLLANSRSSVPRLPLATDTSIERALAALGEHMDKERDLLFVFLTSHGSSDHQLSIGMNGMRLPQLPAKRLGELLKASGIRKQIVVVSACYSGGFVQPLKGPNTWVITAARADRTSFGCADENDFTYFGRALFKESLPQENSLSAAFTKTKKLVAKWEAEQLPDGSSSSSSDTTATAARNQGATSADEDDDDFDDADEATTPASAAASTAGKATGKGADKDAEKEADLLHSEPQSSVTPAFRREVDAWFSAHPARKP